MDRGKASDKHLPDFNVGAGISFFFIGPAIPIPAQLATPSESQPKLVATTTTS